MEHLSEPEQAPELASEKEIAPEAMDSEEALHADNEPNRDEVGNEEQEEEQEEAESVGGEGGVEDEGSDADVDAAADADESEVEEEAEAEEAKVSAAEAEKSNLSAGSEQEEEEEEQRPAEQEAGNNPALSEGEESVPEESDVKAEVISKDVEPLHAPIQTDDEVMGEDKSLHLEKMESELPQQPHELQENLGSREEVMAEELAGEELGTDGEERDACPSHESLPESLKQQSEQEKERDSTNDYQEHSMQEAPAPSPQLAGTDKDAAEATLESLETDEVAVEKGIKDDQQNNVSTRTIENEQDSAHLVKGLISNDEMEYSKASPDENLSITKPTKAKTELEREMELYEAAEEEEQNRLLSSAKPNESHPLQNEKKRTLEASPQESRKKRGKKGGKSSIRKEEDDVCFVCFDGGELVLCDQRSCPKAYHLGCIGRDAEFFRKRGHWYCGWHFCCGCSKKASIRCYTCPKAYCASCRKLNGFLPIRKRKGLCEECVPLVKMIERNEAVYADGTKVDFSDQETYECLFKEYWEDLKAKLSITLPELDKDGKFIDGTGAPPADSDDGSENEGSSSESEAVGTAAAADDDEVVTVAGKKRERKTKVLNALTDEVKCSINQEQKEQPIEDVEEKEEKEEEEEEEEEEEREEEGEAYRPTEFDGWASKELLAFIKKMKEDPKKPMARFAVNKLLWSYIKAHSLQNPRKKSIIRCDEQLRALFGKKAVHHHAMMKYLQYHFPPKGSLPAKKAHSQVATEQVKETDNHADMDDDKGKVKGRLKRKHSVTKPDSHEFAAINQSNINLVYLRRALLEDLLGDPQFDQKAVGTFVRIRVPGMVSKNEMCYRLVQIVGTKRQADEYKAGKKSTDIVLQIMNLHKKEDLTIDLVSNQDFTEEECKRLRQSIRCGFIRAPTVGEFEQKALAIREAKLNDWFETETLRLSALRDRANEKGRKKELRECVEKLKSLADPDYRLKELSKAPVFETDPSMDPDYESSDEPTSTSLQGAAETTSSLEKGRGSTWDRTFDEHHSSKRDRKNDPPVYSKQDSFGSQSSLKKDVFDKGWDNDFDWRDNDGRSNGKSSFAVQKPLPAEQKMDHPVTFGTPLPPPPPRPALVGSVSSPISADMQEKEKIWHYQDPTGTVQGPFSFEQLRKWSTTGLFPADLKVWKTGQLRDQGVLLTDALAGRRPAWGSPPQQGFGASVAAHHGAADAGRVGMWDSSAGARNDWGGGRGGGDWNGSGSHVVHERAAPPPPPPPMQPEQRSFESWSSPRPGHEMGGYHDNGWGGPQHKGPDAWGGGGWGGNDAGAGSKVGPKPAWGREPASSSPWNDPRGVDNSQGFRNSRAQQKKGTPCRFYQKGYCRNGDSCPFQHG